MRILFVTSYYPPAERGGGYMQLCAEVAEGLAAREHAVAVLTSTHGAGQDPEWPEPGSSRPQAIYRRLAIDPDYQSARPGAWQFFVGRRRREQRAVGDLQCVVAEFGPDLIFVWHTLGLPRRLFQEAERLPGRQVAYYLADTCLETVDEYLAYWAKPAVRQPFAWLKRPLAGLALDMLAREGKPISLRCEHVVCVSDYLRRRLVSQGLVPPQAVVIRNGVDLSEFKPGRYTTRPTDPGALRCVISGRVVPDKGVHTAIEALGLLREQAGPAGITLTILGSGPAEYLAYLRERVSHHGLQGAVDFRPPVPRQEMPAALASHDVLILASEVDEALPRAIQEAMAMGLLVIGTITGGSGELLVHDQTGLVFEAGNPESLAAQLVRAIQEPELAATLVECGRQAVVENMDIRQTITRIESYLLALCDGT